MSKQKLLALLRAAAALPSGELGILIAIIAQPNLTVDQLAQQIGGSNRYLSSLLSTMCDKRIITSRVRVIGYHEVEEIFMPHPDLNFETLAPKYVPKARSAASSESCSADLVNTDQEINASMEVPYVI